MMLIVCRGVADIATRNGTADKRARNGGADRNRTDDLLGAIQALSQLSYGPTRSGEFYCMDILIRNAEATDWATIAEFNSALAVETEDKALDWDIVSSGVRRLLADEGKGRYFIAESGGRIVGMTMITYEWSDWRDGWIWWIQSVYVHPDFRGHGVFARLYRHIDACGAEAGVRAVRLYVLKTNTRARAIYEKLGMHESGYTVLETGGD
jgi:ribosomal protein S18 acetylase RimI-like enzyme